MVCAGKGRFGNRMVTVEVEDLAHGHDARLRRTRANASATPRNLNSSLAAASEAGLNVKAFQKKKDIDGEIVERNRFAAKEAKKRAINDVEGFIIDKVDTFEQGELVSHGLLHCRDIGKRALESIQQQSSTGRAQRRHDGRSE